MMKLNEYPQAIANLQRQLLKLDESIVQHQQTLSVLGLEIEKQILADASLSNDAKRKARRLELQQSDLDYCKAANALQAAQAQRERLDIELLLLRNEFSVLKLEERRLIASLELHASTAA